jgi:TonB family protein
VAHAVSASFSRFEHMSPQAAGLALLLHAAIALALWWTAPIRSHDEPAEVIEVTMEQPKPPPPQPEAPKPPAPPATAMKPPAAPAIPPPSPSVPLGLPPPATPAEKPQQVLQNEPTQQQQQALAPQPPAAPPPKLEQSLPEVAMPPPPITSYDLPKPALPPPAPEPKPKPMPLQQPPSPAPQVALRPSPLSHLGQERAPSQSQSKAQEPQSTFVNPAATYTRTRAKDEYLWQVIHKMSQHLPILREKNEGGTVVIRMVIARDGRLLDVGVERSSGVSALDEGMIGAIRAASPYPPFPADIPDAELSYTQPFVARR